MGKEPMELHRQRMTSGPLPHGPLQDSPSQDRPSQDGPSLSRPFPRQAWGKTIALALALLVVGVVLWEAHWRQQGYGTTVRNSDGLWALERRRAVAGDGLRTVIVGSSRVLFDIDFPTWVAEVGGERPVQLALEGTPPHAFLLDLAADSRFRGFLVVGYSPGLFFAPFGGQRGEVLERASQETPAERVGQRLAMVLEQQLAFLDDDTRLSTLLAAVPWPSRAGLPPDRPDVPRLSEMRPTREALMWSRVETDEGYRERARNVWLGIMSGGDRPLPEELVAGRIREVANAVAAIRQRGGEVLFIRCPSTGPWRDSEQRTRPRPQFWDRLLAETMAPGIHFEDHPELQGFELPEWSHLRAADRVPFTQGLAPLVAPIWQRWMSGVHQKAER